MKKIFDTILLLALPASGKSEVRRYLKNLSEEECQEKYHFGPTVQLDDFPYVHIMREIDSYLESISEPRVFFKADDKPFINPLDWGVLIQLLNKDYNDLSAMPKIEDKVDFIFSRIDECSKEVGLKERLKLKDEVYKKLKTALRDEVSTFFDEKLKAIPTDLDGKTLVIEFARGGQHGVELPLQAPMGYQYSLSQLSDEILSSAAILYIYVSPEESRRKNDARTDPNDPGSILHHGVPIEVMMNDYGQDDIHYLMEQSSEEGCVEVKKGDKIFSLPIAIFDNRVDKTTFLREDPKQWDKEKLDDIAQNLKGALDKCMNVYSKIHS